MNLRLTAASRPRPVSLDTVPLDVAEPSGRFLLVDERDGDTNRLEVEGRPNDELALAWERRVRRVVRVEFCRCAGSWTASLHVIGHRIPTRRAISVDTALGLGRRGHPLTLCSDTLDNQGVGHGRLPL